MIQKILLIFFLILSVQLCNSALFSQNNIELNKRQLVQIFKQNYKGTTHLKERKYKKYIQEWQKEKYRYWTSCNNDSSYYKSDTLIMSNYERGEFDCFPKIQWLITGKMKIKYYIPTLRYKISVSTHKIKVKKKKDVGLVISIFDDIALSNGKRILLEEFIVLSLRKEQYKDWDDSIYVMVLKRINVPKQCLWKLPENSK